MNNSTFRVTVLGTRGSLPVSGSQFNTFGGATSSYMIEAAGETLFVDGGTGILNAPKEAGTLKTAAEATKDAAGAPVRILLSHTHIDHILGLPLFLLTHCRGKDVEFYGKMRGGETVEEQLDHLFAPPLWPAKLSVYPLGKIGFHEAREHFRAGAFDIRTMESSHPGGSLIFKVSAAGKSVVIATDFEHGEGREEELAAFAEGTDLLLYDGQYSGTAMPEYAARKGFGHSTEQAGFDIFRKSGARRLRIIHHDPASTDEMLLCREAQLVCAAASSDGAQTDAAFAREGETVEL